MNKIVISAITASLLLGFSQVGAAKEHKGPSADRGSSYSSSSSRDRGASHNRGSRGFERRSNVNRNERGKHRYRGERDRRRHSSNHSRYRDRDNRHYRDRYRNNYRPRYKHRYYKHYHPRTYPRNVYYLGQDWHYYGGYYHPFPRHHIHTRHCHHRYWEPLAVGIILGSVLGW